MEKQKEFVRDSNGQFSSNMQRSYHMSEADFPANTEALIDMYQSYGILPQVIDGYNLNIIRGHKRHGDSLNDGLCFIKSGSRLYASVRPMLCYQDKKSLLFKHRLIWDIMSGKSHTAIATALGQTYNLRGRKISNFQTVTKTRRMMQKVMAYYEEQRLMSEKIGGPWKFVESDAFSNGRKNKNGVGWLSFNKCYIQYVGERGGDIVMECYANPLGGPERIHQISDPFEKYLAPGSFLLTDAAFCYEAWVRDHPEMQITHAKVNHSQAKHYGFVWQLWLDHEDDLGISFGDHKIVDVSTEQADGYAGELSKWLNRKGGVRRADMQAYVKEKQFLTNHGDLDAFDAFLIAWGYTESALRSGKVTMKELDACIQWDHSKYNEINVEAYDSHDFWLCVGCDFMAIGQRANVRNEKSRHKKKCQFYQENSSKPTYSHMKSRCVCCVFHGKKKVNGWKVIFCLCYFLQKDHKQ